MNRHFFEEDIRTSEVTISEVEASQRNQGICFIICIKCQATSSQGQEGRIGRVVYEMPGCQIQAGAPSPSLSNHASGSVLEEEERPLCPAPTTLNVPSPRYPTMCEDVLLFEDK